MRTKSFKCTESVLLYTMEFTKEILEEYLTRWGEVFVVLDSDREYELHGTDTVDYSDRGDNTLVRVEGLHGDEWVKVEFDLADIEHVYTHREV